MRRRRSPGRRGWCRRPAGVSRFCCKGWIGFSAVPGSSVTFQRAPSVAVVTEPALPPVRRKRQREGRGDHVDLADHRFEPLERAEIGLAGDIESEPERIAAPEDGEPRRLRPIEIERGTRAVLHRQGADVDLERGGVRPRGGSKVEGGVAATGTATPGPLAPTPATGALGGGVSAGCGNADCSSVERPMPAAGAAGSGPAPISCVGRRLHGERRDRDLRWNRLQSFGGCRRGGKRGPG